MHPVDWTVAAKGKKIRIVLRTGKVFYGKLINYDSGVNLLVDDLVVHDTQEYIGCTILSGMTIAYIESMEKSTENKLEEIKKIQIKQK
ncbi:hypothetical protein NEOKW01_1328 [Nematocida sp. AWRm80]|nr:hypothetical protein NEOKW01_1328 [Nematocida sp. AWRm80]